MSAVPSTAPEVPFVEQVRCPFCGMTRAVERNSKGVRKIERHTRSDVHHGRDHRQRCEGTQFPVTLADVLAWARAEVESETRVAQRAETRAGHLRAELAEAERAALHARAKVSAAQAWIQAQATDVKNGAGAPVGSPQETPHE